MMAEYPRFADNLRYLIDNGAIPKTEPGHVGQHVMQAINDLSDDELRTLVKLAKTANAHLFIHDKENHVIAMGL
jgi:hypothetical protein